MTHRTRFHSNDHVDHLLPAYINGTLDRETREQVLAHLGLCEACRNDLAEWEVIASATRTFAESLHMQAGQGGSEVPLRNYWEGTMHTAYSLNPSQSAVSGTFTTSAPVSNHVRKLAGSPSTNRLNVWLSAVIVTIMLLGTAGGAWWLGPGGGEPSDGLTRLAAVTQEDSTPLETGTPEGDPNVWTTPVMPEECVADRMSRETYANIMRSGPTPEPRSYLPVTPVDAPLSEEIAAAGRNREACLIYGEMDQWRTLETPSTLYARTAGPPSMSPAEVDEIRQISDHLPVVPFDEQVIYTQERMPRELATRPEGTHEAQMVTLTYLPDYAYQLADGRIAVAIGGIYWANPADEHFKVRVEENPDARGTAYGVFSNVNGTWLYDQQINVCQGDCDEFFGTPVATPQAVTSAPAPLMDLLSAVPATMSGPDQGPIRSWAYADIERRFADLGLTREAIAEDRLVPLGLNAFGPLAWTTPLFHFGADDELVAALGFDPYRTQQVLVAGDVPDMLTLLRGDWDTESLPAAWEASGYTEHTTDSGVTVWSLGPNGEVDPEHPIQRQMFQTLNNVAILGGGVLAFTGTMETLELVLATHEGRSESATDDANMARLLATVPDGTISMVAMNVPGTQIYDLETMAGNPNIRDEDMTKIDEPFVESREAVGPLPDYHGALFGLTSGSNSEDPKSSGEVFVRLGAGSEEDAAQIATVVEWRWDNFLSHRNFRPLNTIMEITDASTDGTTVVLNFHPLTTNTAWMDMLNSGDLAPFAVDDEEGETSSPNASPVATPES